MKAELMALADRVEKGPASREIDGKVFIAITPIPEGSRIDQHNGIVGWWPLDAPYHSAMEVPRFTSSLDAVLHLVPEGCHWAAGTCNEDDGPWACITSPAKGYPDYAGTGATPTLSLLAAILRALASEKE